MGHRRTLARLATDPFGWVVPPSLHHRIQIVPKPFDHLEGDCWLFTGWNNGKGHGIIRIEGRRLYIHRVSYARFHGMTVDQLDNCDHLCRRRGCFQPRHLDNATPRENWERGDGPIYAFKTDEEYAAVRALAESF